MTVLVPVEVIISTINVGTSKEGKYRRAQAVVEPVAAVVHSVLVRQKDYCFVVGSADLSPALNPRESHPHYSAVPSLQTDCYSHPVELNHRINYQLAGFPAVAAGCCYLSPLVLHQRDCFQMAFVTAGWEPRICWL